MKPVFFCLFSILALASICYGGKAHVLKVEIEKNSDGSFIVSATSQHEDDGWNHYADRFELVAMDDTLIDTRVLLHPHSAVAFTRSLSTTKIPSDAKQIRVRAHDSVHGYGGKEVVVNIP